MARSPSSIWPEEGISLYRSRLATDKFFSLLLEEFALQAAGTSLFVSPYQAWLFEHEILQQAGCLEIQHQAEDNYIPINDIHPLFSLSQWDCTDLETHVENAYYIMAPALAVASKIITSDDMLSWWIHTMYGYYDKDKATGKIYLAADPRELDFTQAKADLEVAFQKLTKKLRFYWLPEEKDVSLCSINAWAALKYLDDSWASKLKQHQNEFGPIIGLPTLYLYHLLSERGANRTSVCSNLRLQLHIAKSIVHEVAHAFHALIHGIGIEPYHHLTDYMPEAGYSWEAAVFGCDVSGFPLRSDGIGPLVSTSFDQMHAFPAIRIPLSMKWVEQWFLRETWNDVGLFLSCDSFRPPIIDRFLTQYDGLFYANRFIRSSRVWLLVLYDGGKPKIKEALEIPGGPIPAGNQGSGDEDLGCVPLGQTIEQWWAQISPMEVEEAKKCGFPEECFTIGRSRTYQMQCYDGKGIDYGYANLVLDQSF